MIHTFSIPETELLDTTKCGSSLEKLLLEFKCYKSICSKGVAIYNPFLMREEHSKKEAVLIKPVYTLKHTSSQEAIKPSLSNR